MEKIRVAIIEDDTEIRTTMSKLLSLGAETRCVGDYECAEDFLKAFEQLEVEVVIMDISLPGTIYGIQAIRQAKPKKPSVQFLMCTSHSDAERTFDSLCAGATGYILKTASSDQLIQAVIDIHKGGSPMSPEIARIVVTSFPVKTQNQALLDQLTAREQEIVHALSKGYTYQEIADKLFLSIDTIRTYLRNVYVKLQVHSKVEALNKIFPKG